MRYYTIIINAVLVSTLTITLIFLIQNATYKSYLQGHADGMAKFSDMVIEEYGKNGSLTLDLPEKGQIKLIPEIVETNQ